MLGVIYAISITGLAVIVDASRKAAEEKLLRGIVEEARARAQKAAKKSERE